jgi:hypothetical protein
LLAWSAVFIIRLYPLDAGARAAKYKSRAAKKEQGVHADRQAALSPVERTSETQS